jgi:predicted CoA-binding protein
MFKTTLVLGASTKPERFSNRAVRRLLANDFPVFPVGLREGEIEGIRIQRPFPIYFGIHTVTLYVGVQNQPIYYDYILYLKPKRVIFNPGTENEEFERMLEENGIETLRACTLILLSIGEY